MHHKAANEGVMPPRTWNELYLQTVFDSSVAPAGTHTMSVLAQYVPNKFKEGSWDLYSTTASSHRSRAVSVILLVDSFIPAAFASNSSDLYRK